MAKEDRNEAGVWGNHLVWTENGKRSIEGFLSLNGFWAVHFIKIPKDETLVKHAQYFLLSKIMSLFYFQIAFTQLIVWLSRFELIVDFDRRGKSDDEGKGWAFALNVTGTTKLFYTNLLKKSHAGTSHYRQCRNQCTGSPVSTVKKALTQTQPSLHQPCKFKNH